MADVAELTVDREFAAACPEVTPEEMNLLEHTIRTEGCRDPIIVWAGHDDTIIDGHRRYAICRRFQVPFKTKALKFETRDEVLAWIRTNALARRNMSEAGKAYLRGRTYNEQKQPHGGQVPGGSAHCAHSLTAERLEAETGVNQATIRRDAQYAAAVDAIAANVPDAKAAILSGEIKATRKDLLALATLPAAEQQDAVGGGADGIKAAAKKAREMKSSDTPPTKPKRTKTYRISTKAAEIARRVEAGAQVVPTCGRLGMGASAYHHAIAVVRAGNAQLVAAMDDGLLSTDAACRLLKTPDKIDAAIAEAQAKRLMATIDGKSIKGKTQAEVVAAMIEMAWSQLYTLVHYKRLVPKAVPPTDEAKRSLARMVRGLNQFLPAITKWTEENCDVH